MYISIPFLLGILIVALTIIFLLSAGARPGIAGFLRGTGFLIHAAFLWAWNLFRRFWWILLIIVSIITIILTFAGFSFSFSIMKLGEMFGLKEISIFLLILIVIVFLFSLLSWIFPQTRIILKWLIIPLTITTCVIMFCGGIWWLFGELTPSSAGVVETTVGARAERAEVAARQYAQAQKTWKISPEAVVFYDCKDGDEKCKALRYNTEVRVISMGEYAKVGGETYEKCSIPNPDTGLSGWNIAWIKSMDLKPAGTPPPISSAKIAFTPPAIEARSKGGELKYMARFQLLPGKWLIEPFASTLLLDGQKETMTGKEGVTIEEATDVTIFARSRPIKVTPM